MGPAELTLAALLALATHLHDGAQALEKKDYAGAVTQLTAAIEIPAAPPAAVAAARLLRAEALTPRPPLDLRPSPEALPTRPELPHKPLRGRVDLPPALAAYRDRIVGLAPMQRWIDDSAAEVEDLADH